MLKQFKKAFTLAEVLIVIGIIGVVAALTLPNLNHATGDKETVTRVKKIYSTLTEAFDRAQVIYGPIDTWFNAYITTTSGYGTYFTDSTAVNEKFAKRITEFLKISKDCGFDEGCFSSELLSDFLIDYSYYMVSLKDGISLGFNIMTPDSDPRIIVDINGPNNGKNKSGIDIFDFHIKSTDTKSMYQVFPYSDFSILYNGLDLTYGYAAWVIENGNLDYLKCPDELNWETKTSCE